MKPSKSETTASKILDAALTLFREQGFEAATMRAIAEPATLRQRLNIVEARLQRLRRLLGIGPQLHLAQPRQVHQQPAARHAE